MKYLLACITLILTSSCSNYRSYFDCPSYPGAGCKSVSQIEEMIVENEIASDYFPTRKCRNTYPAHNDTPFPVIRIDLEQKKRAWICPHVNSSGQYVEGHYVYFNLEATSPEGQKQ